jgi:heme exporter protein B
VTPAAPETFAAARALLARDLRLAARHGAETLTVVGFFVIAVSLFPFGVGPEPNTLARIGPGVIWVAALLSVMMGLERLFLSDFEDGSLELTVLSPCPLWSAALAKTVALWLSTALPVVIASPVLGLLMAMEPDAVALTALTLFLGTPSLCLVGGVGAALVLGARRAGVLIALLVLPLYVPVLIFGVGAVDAATTGFPYAAQLSFLGAYALAALALCPWAMAAALRQAVE